MAKKNPDQISLFPETVYEYFILLSPSDAIKQDVDNLKQKLHEMIGLDSINTNSIAHLSLFKRAGIDATDIIKGYKKALSGQKKFPIKLSGHGIFTHANTKTLYVKVEEPEPIDSIYNLLNPPKRAPKKIERQISILDKPGYKPKSPKSINPHITIARNIPIADFERIPDLTIFDYHNEWICECITILRRPFGSDKYFSPVAEIKLS